MSDEASAKVARLVGEMDGKEPTQNVKTGSMSKPTQKRSAEREAQFQSLMALYHPPTTLRKQHKDLLKTAWSIRQGYDGTKLECFTCKKLLPFGSITVHHKDNEEKHNDADNLEPDCFECNRAEGEIVRRRIKAEVATRERERAILAHTPTAPQPGESESLRRHKEQRLAFNLWLYHPKTGFTEGSTISKRGVYLQAVDVVGKGSSKTYWFYVEEDIAGGYWEQKDTPNGEMIERTAKPFPLERMGMRGDTK